jgi:gliding motility-associated-like protein
MKGIYKQFKVLNAAIFGVLLFCGGVVSAQSQLPAKAAFTQDKLKGCLPLVVNFNSTASGNIAAYYWELGNGNISSLKNPGAVYTKAGNYSVKLIVTDISGAKDTLEKKMLITALANPIAGFSVSGVGGCEDEEFSFLDTTIHKGTNLAKWQWSFGDGANDTTPNPKHKFAKAGTYGVSLIVQDDNGCKSYVNKNKLITVTEKIKVSFSADNTGACTLPLKVNFTNSSSINNAKQYAYKWKFGTGDSSAQQNPSFTYTKMGEYDVELTITDANECVNALAIKKYISIGKTQANFSVKNNKGCIPYTPDFENKSVGVPSNATYTWYFSNGDSAVGQQPNYVFTKAGVYSVTLAITSPSGCNDTKTINNSITVLQAPVATFSHNNPVSCSIPHEVNYAPALKNSKAWTWDFGDGETSTQKNPKKIYTTPGVYDVTLTITDNNGCENTFTKKRLVKVNTQIAQFNPSVDHGCIPLKVNFSNNSQSYFGITKYEWDFGNGKTSNQQQPNITYNQAGTYYPKLIIKDNNGCSDTMVFDSIPVGIKTNPNFYTNRRAGCTKDMRIVEFYNKTNTLSQRVDSFYWDFTNITSTDVHPIIDYVTHPGVYDVKLVSYSNGCADTLVKKDYVTIYMPDADAHITEDPCVLDTVNFKNTSIGGHIFSWTLDDDTVSQTQEFDRFLNPGSYHLELFVKDTITGCWDTKEYTIEIREPLNPGFTVNVDSICANTNFLVQDTTPNIVLSTWQFGNGTNATGKTQTPFYYNPGIYDITLNVTDIYGCQESITKPNTIKILGADFTPIVTPNQGCFPLDAQLIKVGQSAHGIESVIWSEGSQQIKSFADTIPYSFNTQSSNMHTDGKRVYLSITDNLGCTVSRNATVKLSKPVAAIAHASNLLCDETKVDFYHNTNHTQNIGALNFVWTLNGTETFNQENNTKAFTKEGVNNFKLIIEDKAFGCKDSTEIDIKVITKQLNANFLIDETEIPCPPLISTFTDASTIRNTTIANVAWNFGDGAASELTQPIKNYFYPGNYDISYKITDVDGCEDSILVKSQIKVGGPTGEYEIDKDKACVPFNVVFTSKSKNAKLIDWDFGNGQLGNGYNTTTEYVIPSTYTPTFVVQDSFGCKVIYPVKPITGLASPQPVFSVAGKCLYDVFSFDNIANNTDGEDNINEIEYEWTIDGANNSKGTSTTYKFNTAGKHKVALKATLNNECSATTTKEIVIKDLKANYTAYENPLCRFTYINLNDKSTAEAGIATWEWSLGDGRKDSVQNPHYFYPQPGEYQIALIIKDKVGCYDTLNNGELVQVFDTLTPPTPLAHRVTVKDDNKIRLEFSPYLSRDYDSYVVFKSTKGGAFQLYKTIYNQLDTIVIDSDVNTFAQSYSYKIYSQTKCGKQSVSGESDAHTSILLQTQADTNKVLVNWSAYKGWDNLGSYTLYRQSPDVNAYIAIATVNASTTNYTDTNVICGYSYNYLIFASQDTENPLLSRSNNSIAKPFHKSTVQPAYLVRATVKEDKHTLIEFAKPTTIKAPIASYSLEKSIDGINFKEILKTEECCVPFEDFKTNVHSQSYYYRVITTDVCGDKSIASNIGKTILLKAETDEEDNVNVTWSKYQKWDEGIASYEIEQMGNSSIFETVGRNNFIDTAFVDASNLFNQIDKVCYCVKAISNTGVVSYSNIDCAKGRSTLFVPNAFTPNGDGNNNVFKIVGAYIKDYELNIYNRYGEKIYTSYSLDDSWDGMYKNETAQEGAYLVVINAKGLDYKAHNYSGTVTLLR